MLTATPQDILESTNAHIVTAIQGWKAGKITWEQALMTAVLGLSREVNHLKSGYGPSPLLAAAPFPMLAAAEEALEFNKPIAVEVPKVTVTPERIEHFKRYGHWPEGSPQLPALRSR